MCRHMQLSFKQLQQVKRCHKLISKILEKLHKIIITAAVDRVKSGFYYRWLGRVLLRVATPLCHFYICVDRCND